MTPRQSNIIFYTVLSFIVTAVIIHKSDPDFFGDMGKSQEELLLKEAVLNGDHQQALSVFQILIEERINKGKEIKTETAEMYEDMAKLYYSLDQKAEAKIHYLKSLNIKEQLKRNHVFDFANTYFQLGALEEEEQQYDQAQAYYEQSLSKRLGDTAEAIEEGGFTSGLLKAQTKHKRFNNKDTIATLKKLAAIHVIKKEHSIAKTYYESALTASKQTFGEDDNKTLEIIDLMNQLAH